MILHFKFNILVIFTKGSIQVVSNCCINQRLTKKTQYHGNSPYGIAATIMFNQAGRSGKTASLPSLILLTMIFFYIY